MMIRENPTDIGRRPLDRESGTGGKGAASLIAFIPAWSNPGAPEAYRSATPARRPSLASVMITIEFCARPSPQATLTFSRKFRRQLRLRDQRIALVSR